MWQTMTTMQTYIVTNCMYEDRHSKMMVLTATGR